ncbi:MAG: YfhO family protein [Chloroflexi bacterium]|nr:YfhO family protein [Chloroflexota bacterium]
MLNRKLLFIDQTSLFALWPLLLPVLLLLPGISGFPYPSPDALNSDMAISHYPNALFLKRAVLTWGSLPLWSPTILSGYPFFANPLSGIWYIPGWLALLFPLPLGFNLTVIVHMLWGGLGMYLFLRIQRLSHLAALFGAISFEAMPKIFAHYGAGHLTLMYAVPWTPWLLLAAVRSKSSLKSSAYFGPSIILATIFLADVRWAAYSGALWLAWEVANKHFGYIRTLLHSLMKIALAALLAAPLAIPLMEYTRLSTRANLKPSDVLEFSLPPTRLLGFIFPDFGGQHEWMLYMGGVVLSLTFLSVLWPRSRKRSYFWVGVLAVSVLFSLGEYLPFLSSFTGLPGFSLLRVPSRALFLAGTAGSILAAYALNHLLAGIRQDEARRGRLALVTLAAFAVTLGAAIWMITGQLPINMLWGSAVLIISFVWIALYLNRKLPKNVLVLGIFALSIIDLGIIDSSLFAFHPTSEVLSEGKEVAQFLASQPERFRVYSPSYSLPQQTAAFYSLELADGVDPLQLLSYADYMEIATGIPSKGYSVTLPPFQGMQSTAKVNAEYLPTSDLSMLNVRYIVAAFDLDIKYTELRRFGNTRVYEIPNEVGYAHVNNSDSLGVETLAWSPNRIEFSAEGPGTFILAEIPYPGWRAYVDGQRVEIMSVEGVNRSIELEDGLHTITFVFKPISLFIGLGLSIITVTGLIIVSRRNREKINIDE